MTYSICNDAFGLSVSCSTGERIGHVASDTHITSSTDSHSVVEECRSIIDGEVVLVEHDRDTIHVFTSTCQL